MTHTDIAIIAVVILIIAAALIYIIRAKRSGRKCIGCPDSGSCHNEKVGTYSCRGSCSSCTACRSTSNDEKSTPDLTADPQETENKD